MMTFPKNNWNMPPMTLWVVTAAVMLCAVVWVGGCSPLTAFNTLVPADSGGAAAKSDITYGRHPRQKLDVYVPSKQSAAAPVVVVIYGGSWNSGNKNDYAFLGKALSSRGFVAVIADYRLVPEIRFPAFLEDTAEAVAWARTNARQFGGDPDQLYLLGHSAGAYNAVMVALDGQYLRGFGAEPSQIRGVIGLAGPYDFLPLDAASTIAAFGKASDLSKTQPINFVSRNAPAMLLATGDADTTVYPRNTVSLSAKLKASGASVTVRHYPGVGHIGIMLALSLPLRGTAPVLDDITKFINGER